MTALVPADPKRCQAEITTPQNPFAWGSRRKVERCPNKPSHIARETTPGADGLKGSMSVCATCLPELVKQAGNRIALEAIA